MDASKLDRETESIADVVTRDKVDAVSAGIVKDDRSQMLSVLAEAESAVGGRAGRTRGSKAIPQAPTSTAPGVRRPQASLATLRQTPTTSKRGRSAQGRS